MRGEVNKRQQIGYQLLGCYNGRKMYWSLGDVGGDENAKRIGRKLELTDIRVYPIYKDDDNRASGSKNKAD